LAWPDLPLHDIFKRGGTIVFVHPGKQLGGGTTATGRAKMLAAALWSLQIPPLSPPKTLTLNSSSSFFNF
jgi:hypothetical protein